MPNNDYDMDKKVEISADEMCNIIAKTMAEEPFDSIITKNLGMSIFFLFLERKFLPRYFVTR